ncbi:MAG: hypothetical protein C5B52_17960 [Bacteroidetes bacterium]|nr:MAG: hypothetical protein C5B52_17960 [Bacteroidota bacterium]
MVSIKFRPVTCIWNAGFKLDNLEFYPAILANSLKSIYQEVPSTKYLVPRQEIMRLAAEGLCGLA